MYGRRGRDWRKDPRSPRHHAGGAGGCLVPRPVLPSCCSRLSVDGVAGMPAHTQRGWAEAVEEVVSEDGRRDAFHMPLDTSPPPSPRTWRATGRWCIALLSLRRREIKTPSIGTWRDEVDLASQSSPRCVSRGRVRRVLCDMLLALTVAQGSCDTSSPPCPTPGGGGVGGLCAPRWVMSGEGVCSRRAGQAGCVGGGDSLQGAADHMSS